MENTPQRKDDKRHKVNLFTYLAMKQSKNLAK